MNNMCVLTNLAVGQSAKIGRLDSQGGIRRRLQDIGLIEGTRVECVLKSPAADPIAYRVRGAVIALRNEDSDRITVSL